MTSYTRISACLGLAMVLAAPAVALADPWKDESGHGRRGWWDERGQYEDRDGRRRGRGEERRRGRRDEDERYTYDDGECRVEVRRDRSGEVHEERRCRGPAVYGDSPLPHPYYEAPPPAYRYAPPASPARPAPRGRGSWIDPDGS